MVQLFVDLVFLLFLSPQHFHSLLYNFDTLLNSYSNFLMFN